MSGEKIGIDAEAAQVILDAYSNRSLCCDKDVEKKPLELRTRDGTYNEEALKKIIYKSKKLTEKIAIFFTNWKSSR